MSPIVSALEHLILQLVALFGEIQMELPCWWDKLLGVGFKIKSLAPFPVEAPALLCAYVSRCELSASCACHHAISTIVILTLWNRNPDPLEQETK